MSINVVIQHYDEYGNMPEGLRLWMACGFNVEITWIQINKKLRKRYAHGVFGMDIPRGYRLFYCLPIVCSSFSTASAGLDVDARHFMKSDPMIAPDE